MRSFPAAFTAAIAKNSGTPIWFLALTTGGVTYYLSDQGRSIPTWNGGVTLRPWVTSWGQVTESLSLGLAEILVSDFSATFRIDPKSSPNMEDLASAADIEASVVTLYLWFAGLDAATNPPQALWAGYVTDVEIPDDATVSMTFEDASNRLRGDLGLVVRVDSLPLPGYTLSAQLLLDDFIPGFEGYIYMFSTAGMIPGTILTVESEIMEVVVVTNSSALQVLRGQNGTTMVKHVGYPSVTAVVPSSVSPGYPTADPDDVGKILPVVFGVVKNLPPVATAAGRLTSLKADITAVATSAIVLDVTGLAVNDYLDIGDEDVKITNINSGTLTLTIARAQNSTTAAAHVAGEAVIQQVALYKLIAAQGAVTSINRVLLRSGTDIDITDLVTRYTGQDGSIYAATGYTGHAVVTLTVAQVKAIRARLTATTVAVDNPAHDHGYTATRSQAANNTPFTGSGSFYPTYPAVSGGIEQTTTFNFTWSGGGASTTILVNGNVLTQYSGFVSGSGTWTVTTVGIPPITINNGTIHVQAVTRSIVYSETADSTSQNTSVTINSALDSAIGGQILVDVTAPESTPKAAIEKILGETLTLTGSFPAGYAVNGAVLSPQPIIDIINQIAFECRAWFRYMAGIPRLIVRPDTLSSARTLTACALDSNKMRLYSRKKTAVDDIVNTITLRYGRDYTQAGDEAYTLTSTATDSTSIATHGTRQDDDLFRCDFITSATMADSVRDYYLGRYAARGWEHRFSVFLDQLPVEFSDVVTLAFAGNVIGEVVESRLTPGQGDVIDRIELVVET